MEFTFKTGSGEDLLPISVEHHSTVKRAVFIVLLLLIGLVSAALAQKPKEPKA